MYAKPLKRQSFEGPEETLWLLSKILHGKLVNKPILIHIGYRRWYGLYADISVCQPRPTPLALVIVRPVWRHCLYDLSHSRPICHLISVFSQYTYSACLCHRFEEKIWKFFEKVIKNETLAFTWHLFEQPQLYFFIWYPWNYLQFLWHPLAYLQSEKHRNWVYHPKSMSSTFIHK